MRVLYMGTPDFAATVLEGLYRAGHEIVGVISQPDRPKNRGMHMEYTAVKRRALDLGLSVYQPDSLKNEAILPYLTETAPEIIVVVAYGKILPEYILSFFSPIELSLIIRIAAYAVFGIASCIACAVASSISKKKNKA